jgi:hypothetical protein
MIYEPGGIPGIARTISLGYQCSTGKKTLPSGRRSPHFYVSKWWVIHTVGCGIIHLGSLYMKFLKNLTMPCLVFNALN